MVEEAYEKDAEDGDDVVSAEVGDVAADARDGVADVGGAREGGRVEELLPGTARGDEGVALVFESGDEIGDASGRRGLELGHRRVSGNRRYRRRWRIGGGELGIAGGGGRVSGVGRSTPGGDSGGRGRRDGGDIGRGGGSGGCGRYIGGRWCRGRRGRSDSAVGGGGSGGGIGGAPHGGRIQN